MKEDKVRKNKTWEDFERLIAHFEEFLSPRGAIVTHDARLRDRDTGELRQVDCTIQYRVGSVDLLIAIECRKRSSPEDVRWIEELEGKRKSIGADIIVAVSSTGFSRSSLIKARKHGVQLRRVDKINVQSFIEDLTWRLRFEYYEIKEFNLSMGGKISRAAQTFLDVQFNIQKHTAKKDLRIIRHEQISGQLTPKEVFELLLNDLKTSGKLLQGVEQSSDTGSIELAFKFNFGQKWSIPYESEEIRLLEMIVRFTLYESDNKLTPMSDQITYLNGDGKVLAAIQKYLVEGDNDFFKDVSISLDPENESIYVEANLRDGGKLSSPNAPSPNMPDSIFSVEI